MKIFKIPLKVTDPVLSRIFMYINDFLNTRIQAVEVTFSTNMNTDVPGEAGDIVRCSTDNKFYGCSVSGVAGSATWVAFN